METTLTLQQGLEKFTNTNKKYFSKRIMTANGAAFLKCHDIAHVIFGCDTSLYGEGIVKIWTTFGTTLSFWKIIRGYQEVNAFELAKKFSLKHVLKNIFKFLISIPKTIIRARKMHKPWDFEEYEPFLNSKISEIRKEFGIQVL